SKVYPVFEAAQCRGCHAHNGVASATRLQFPDKDAPANRVQAFGLSLSALVDRGQPSQSLLLLKPTKRITHAGGERIKPGPEEETLLAKWIGQLAASTDESLAAARAQLGAGAAPAEALPLVRRLTHSQYNNTARDLLGDYSRPAQRFPAEDF